MTAFLTLESYGAGDWKTSFAEEGGTENWRTNKQKDIQNDHWFEAVDFKDGHCCSWLEMNLLHFQSFLTFHSIYWLSVLKLDGDTISSSMNEDDDSMLNRLRN